MEFIAFAFVATGFVACSMSSASPRQTLYGAFVDGVGTGFIVAGLFVTAASLMGVD